MGRRAKEINEFIEGSVFRFTIPVGTRQDKIDLLNQLLMNCKTQQNIFWYLVEEFMISHNSDRIITKLESNNYTNKTEKNTLQNYDIKNTESKHRKYINTTTPLNEKQNNDIILSENEHNNNQTNNGEIVANRNTTELQHKNNTFNNPLPDELHKNNNNTTQNMQIRNRLSSNSFK